MLPVSQRKGRRHHLKAGFSAGLLIERGERWDRLILASVALSKSSSDRGVFCSWVKKGVKCRLRNDASEGKTRNDNYDAMKASLTCVSRKASW